MKYGSLVSTGNLKFEYHEMADIENAIINHINEFNESKLSIKFKLSKFELNGEYIASWIDAKVKYPHHIIYNNQVNNLFGIFLFINKHDYSKNPKNLFHNNYKYNKNKYIPDFQYSMSSQIVASSFDHIWYGTWNETDIPLGYRYGTDIQDLDIENICPKAAPFFSHPKTDEEIEKYVKRKRRYKYER